MVLIINGNGEILIYKNTNTATSKYVTTLTIKNNFTKFLYFTYYIKNNHTFKIEHVDIILDSKTVLSIINVLTTTTCMEN